MKTVLSLNVQGEVVDIEARLHQDAANIGGLQSTQFMLAERMRTAEQELAPQKLQQDRQGVE